MSLELDYPIFLELVKGYSCVYLKITTFLDQSVKSFFIY